MKSVLVLYYSHGGHTARIARRIWETIIAEGHKADLMGIVEADREGVDWNKYDTVIIGCAVIYGKMNHELLLGVAHRPCRGKVHPGRQPLHAQVPRKQPLEA